MINKTNYDRQYLKHAQLKYVNLELMSIKYKCLVNLVQISVNTCRVCELLYKF